MRKARTTIDPALTRVSGLYLQLRPMPPEIHEQLIAAAALCQPGQDRHAFAGAPRHPFARCQCGARRYGERPR